MTKIANLIATKSPIAIVGIKQAINAPKNKIVEQGLHDIIRTNMSQLFANDVADAVTATLSKSAARFQKL